MDSSETTASGAPRGDVEGTPKVTLAEVLDRLRDEVAYDASDIADIRLQQATPTMWVYRVYPRGSSDYDGGLISFD